jgi:hypothetical protein
MPTIQQQDAAFHKWLKAANHKEAQVKGDSEPVGLTDGPAYHRYNDAKRQQHANDGQRCIEDRTK